MSRLFDVVRELSGQSANITISRPYISLFKGNYTHAAVLSQLVFWSSTKPQGEWFYKSNDELGEELSLTVDQVRNSVRQIKSKLNGVLETARKKANGAPTTHYRIDGDALVDLLFPPSEHISQMDSVDLPNGNGTSTESNRENSQILGSGTSTDSINRSKPYTNKQILPPSPPEGEKSGQIVPDVKPKSSSKKITVDSDLDFSVLGEISPEQIQMILRIRKSKRANVTQNVLNQLAKQFGIASRDYGLSLQDCLDEWEFRNWQGFKAEWLSRTNRSLSEINQDTSWIEGMDHELPKHDDLSWTGG
ncbi:ATPase [Vibrio sp. 1978]|uniref:ATPase n=1 Tax=Vibrio sp. 1978 TaxID=3074585 RepID=UPI002966421E|nr:ATPase [Vibrio sp. 1978]MDW3058703.1 ATPase [Vibrio sp. 1978]